jgi:hypothetical protein
VVVVRPVRCHRDRVVHSRYVIRVTWLLELVWEDTRHSLSCESPLQMCQFHPLCLLCVEFDEVARIPEVLVHRVGGLCLQDRAFPLVVAPVAAIGEFDSRPLIMVRKW